MEIGNFYFRVDGNCSECSVVPTNCDFIIGLKRLVSTSTTMVNIGETVTGLGIDRRRIDNMKTERFEQITIACPNFLDRKGSGRNIGKVGTVVIGQIYEK